MKQTIHCPVCGCLSVLFYALNCWPFSASFSTRPSYSPRQLALCMVTPSDVGNSTMVFPFTQEETFSSSLTFSLDPVQDASRRAAFQKLRSTILSLDGEIVPDAIAQEREGENVVRVNSLIFEGSSDSVLIILKNTDTVDTSKVEQLLDWSTVRLAPAELVEQACGFPPGSVPPIGHSPYNLRTIVDEQLLDIDMLWGGGGHPEHSSLLKTEALLKLNHVETADITVQSSEMIESIAVNGDSIHTRPDAPKPFFPIAPPPLSVAQDYCDNPEARIPLAPEPVTIVGRITGVRQMAKRLVFADIAPPDYIVKSVSNDDDDYPWKCGVDGTEMAVQLIAGKTLCNALGDIAGPAALRRIKREQLLLIKGKTNVDNRNSLRNWVQKKSLDIVVFSYQLLEEATPLTQTVTSASVKSNAELRRLQLSALAPSESSLPVLVRNRAPSPRPKSSASTHLTLNHLYPRQNGATPVTMVDDIESVNDFATKISQLLLSLTTSTDNMNVEATAEAVPGANKIGLIGMDCEWRPSFLAASPSEPQPILLLQISVHSLKQVFLFDAKALFRPLQDEAEPMTELEAAASETLMDVFSSQRLLKVGFQLGQDLRRLASSYPHIPAFRLFNAVVEVATLAKKAMQLKRERNSKYHTASLSRVTEFLLGKSINKDQQVSDWALRPLAEEQIEYASLDAAVSPVLFEKALCMAEAGIFTDDPSRSTSLLQIGRWEDDTMFTGAVLSWRFLVLDTNDPAAIRKLKAKRIVGEQYIVTQRWHTGGKEPMRPSIPTHRDRDGPYTDVHGVFRMPSNLVRITAGKDPVTIVDHIVGERVGRSKEKCIESLLTGEAALPENAKIEFHQRSGYVDFADGAAVFLNMPDKNYKKGYPNEWQEDGKFLTWYLRKSEWNDGRSALAQKLLQSEQTEGELPCVSVLFVRMAKGVFLCCGRCRATSTTAGEPEDETANGVNKVGDWGLVQLQLELLDREKLQESDDFEAMVESWLGNARSAATDYDSIAGNVAADSSSKVMTGTSVEPNQMRMHTLAEVVLTGNIIGALALALQQANVPLEERSLARGMEMLKHRLSNDTSEESTKALKLLDEAD